MLAMEVIEIAANIVRGLEKQGITGKHIVVMSKEFGAEMAKQLGVGQDDPEGAEPGEIAGLEVAYNDEAASPLLVTAAGKVYSLLPDWAKASIETHGKIVSAQTSMPSKLLM